MLPTRSRLRGWNPESLEPAAAAIRSAGATVYQAVRNLDDQVDRMPQAQAWQHTEHRDELTDSRAARRLEAMT